MDPVKVSAVTTWGVLENHKQLQCFLSFANVYCQFIWNYSAMAAPLAALIFKMPFQWTPTAKDSFQTLKAQFRSPNILWMPDPTRQFDVEVDAPALGVGAVLSQRSATDQKLHPCAFFSRHLL